MVRAGLTVDELEGMMRMVDVEPHQDKIFLEDFLTFVQRTLFAPLKAANLARIEELFDLKVTAKQKEQAERASAAALTRSAAARPSRARAEPAPGLGLSMGLPPPAADGGAAAKLGLLGKAQTEEVLAELGLHLDQVTYSEVFEEVDADGDGQISHGEFVAAVGMLKRNFVETLQLEKAFTRLRDRREMTGAETLNEHLVYASDLVATLGVTTEEAEEMIFIADLSSTRCVDVAEFKALVVNWTG